ncbi:U32 family peptidase [bacterium]|nr:U32 family peptidase [bacterium]
MTREIELLAPAGHWQALHAAIENGADAVYFGVDAHNARARAANFPRDELAKVMSTLHSQGVLGYLTLNTLIFPSEMDGIQDLIAHAAACGTDALIVQDIGLARLARQIAPELPVHASTQMTVTSASGVRAAAAIGCSRVILARELSVKEIGRIHAEEPSVELETFVHGALCVAYSGQCLTSEALGGRSANRGECAQACRMPYEVICDDERVDLGDVEYLLSPQDLAAYDLVPELAAAGVSSLKIEGRLKSAEYVAAVTRHYRRAIDAWLQGRDPHWTPDDKRHLELTFSRGLTHGFLDGNNHKRLVRGDFSNKRGPHVGFVESVAGDALIARLHAPLKAGDGIMVDVDENDQENSRAVGGRIFDLKSLPSTTGGKLRERPEDSTGGISGRVRITIFRGSLDVSKVRPGQSIWQTSDPRLDSELRESFEKGPKRRQKLDLRVVARVGEPLEVAGTTELGAKAHVAFSEPAQAAAKRPADLVWVTEHLGKLGDTSFVLGDVELQTDGTTLAPASVLNQLRRDLVAKLDAVSATLGQERSINLNVVKSLRERMAAAVQSEAKPAEPELTCLVRDYGQLREALTLGLKTVYADFQDIGEYREASKEAGAAGVDLWLASPRIEKPGEYNLFRFLEKCEPAGILVRNAGGVEFCRAHGLRWRADFSLNVTNAESAEHFKALGAERLTAGFDLSVSQLVELLKSAPAAWFEVVVHQRVAMFHMEHCVFCMTLSPGTDKTNCGRPCDTRKVELQDRVGLRHRLFADVGCRNTLFNATPQSAAESLPALAATGAASFRLEFVDESPATVREVVEAYRDALAGRLEPRNLWRRVKASNQYGLTRGSLQVVS